MDDTFAITAAASGEVDAADLWRALADGADAWRDVNKWTQELPERVAELAGHALDGTGDTEPGDISCVIGSVYGSGHVAETIRARLDSGARTSLAPESFLYFNAHGVTSLICLRHRLSGFCATLLGSGAGLQALAVAQRRLRTAPGTPVLCGAYDLLSPAATRALGGVRPAGWAAFVVLESAERARRRGARVLARIGPVRTCAPTAARTADVRASAPLAELAAALADDTAAPALTLTAAGSRHGYRCTAHKEG
ncbi:3-oxoacyl-ACP synthase [Streptomyces sp. NPDC047123]|uniref:3-oxoacyl-ACP synthase n=1 Tax=Streptomyces sp. NPDC047123 TaxID=3155622 RepID=UPI0033D12E77